MKKTIAISLSLFVALSLTACGNSANRTESSSEGENIAESVTNDDLDDISSVEDSSRENAESEDALETRPEEAEASKEQETRVLVAYFSATNTTEGVAEHIANGLDADLYEIVPENPYTDEDLNYNDNNSRTTIEMNDPDARPVIAGSVENMEQYDIVFIGYPIWWGEAPRIVSTFVESYDFAGKTVVPFCTSGGSGIGSSGTNLERLTSGAQWLEGRRFSGSDSQDTVMEWIKGLGLDL